MSLMISQIEKLSAREKEILYHIALGKKSFQIARSLSLSPETVRSHRKNIMIKLDALNAAGMIRRAFEERLLHF